jgi:hypothetical protein
MAGRSHCIPAHFRKDKLSKELDISQSAANLQQNPVQVVAAPILAGRIDAVMIVVAAPRNMNALAAAGTPVQLQYRQKIPSEPRTSAKPHNPMRIGLTSRSIVFIVA